MKNADKLIAETSLLTDDEIKKLDDDTVTNFACDLCRLKEDGDTNAELQKQADRYYNEMTRRGIVIDFFPYWGDVLAKDEIDELLAEWAGS